MIRKYFKSDLQSLLEIEQAVHVVPWTADTFKICFQSGYDGWVVALEKKVIGFVIVALTSHECHILNVGVARQHQHQGWGRQLLQHALSQARLQGAGIIYLEVRRSNNRAIALYRKMKFHLVGERKNYYPTQSGNEDALIFAKSLHTNIDIPT
ncbi:MAG: ribosomal protein S18-alanine N-acetyltransferase [Gammaproteobacteria bacterium]|nr:ribosomal protein S18-alanine N-acetyltransferase [Gammaproteobacteria bacterium]